MTPPMNIEQELLLSTYEVLGREIMMQSDPEVWSPYSAKEMMTFLTDYGYLEEIEKCSVLDLGTGSGIIGILCGILGAKEVTVTDYSHPAVALAIKNGELNEIRLNGIESDRFEALQGKIFDFIISNPPVQPWLFTDLEHLEKRTSSAAWNEAGADGRLVLDSLIKEGSNHLSEQGSMIFSCSTRHGHRQTTQLLNENWKNYWRQIYTMEHSLDPDYHAPYIPTWKHLQELDLDLRIYQKDAKGREFARQLTEDNVEVIITTLEIDEEKVPVKMICNDEFCEVLDLENEILLLLDLNDARIPKETIDENWYYKYILIQTNQL